MVFSKPRQGKDRILTYSQNKKVIMLQTGQTKPDLMEPHGDRTGMTAFLVNTISGCRRAEWMNLQCASVISVTVGLLFYFSFLQHFVSERKYDEELGKAARFSCDIEQLKAQIMLCGESEFCILAK